MEKTLINIWKDKKKRETFFLAFLLTVQFIIVIICNFAFSRQRIDRDVAKMYVHLIEMWRNHTLFIPDWSYVSTLEIDCSSMLALPLFALTKDIYLSFAISNTVFVMLLIWVLFQMFKGYPAAYPLFCANMLLIPYGVGMTEYFNMLFFNGGQYIIKILIPLLLIALLVRWEEKHRITISEIIMLTVFSVFTFISSCSSGIYALACGIVSVLGGYLFYKLLMRQPIPFAYWGYGVWAVILSGSGILTSMNADVSTKGMQMTLNGITGQFQDNFFAAILGIFELFKAVPFSGGVAVMSYDGLNMLLRMGYVLILCFSVYIMARRVVQKKESIISCLLIAMFVWNLFILLVCNTRYGSATFEYRYHLMGMLPAMCITGKLFWDYYRKETLQRKRLMACTAFVLFVLLFATSYKAFSFYKIDLTQLQKICDYAADKGVEEAYFYQDTIAPETLRLLDYDNVVYLTITDENGYTVVYDYYEKYCDYKAKFDNALFIISKNYDINSEQLEMFGEQFRMIETIGEWYIYQSNKE